MRESSATSRLQPNDVRAIAQVRATTTNALRDYLRRKGFLEFVAPTVVAGVDTGRAFRISYYGKSRLLTTSHQLYKEASLRMAPRVFAFQPCFRNEKRRVGDKTHLAEFWQLDAEWTCELERTMTLVEGLIEAAVRKVGAINGELLKVLGISEKVLRSPFRRIRYASAQYRGSEPSSSSNDFVWITHFPRKLRPEWYYADDPHDSSLTLTADLYYPLGYGEAVSAGQRQMDERRVARQIARTKGSIRRYQWYLSARRGLPVHSGFGLGIERLLRWVCELDNVSLTTPFARAPGITSD